MNRKLLSYSNVKSNSGMLLGLLLLTDRSNCG